MADTTSTAELKRAQDEFAHHLANRTPEAVWQNFFAKHRYVLSRSLPLKLLPCDVVPLGRPGRSEPDFVLCPGSPDSRRLHGIVELKTNTSQIVRRARRNVLTLTADAQTAVAQLRKYDRQYDEFSPVRRAVTFETATYMFVIMGQTMDLDRVVGEMQNDFRTLMDQQIRFITYDDLFKDFSSSLPKPILLLNAFSADLTSYLSILLRRTRRVEARLHRLEPLSSLTIGGAESLMDLEGIIARGDQKSDGAPIMPFPPAKWATRFRPAGIGGLNVATDLECAVAEIQAHGPRSSGTIHLSFSYAGDVVELDAEPATQRLLDPHDWTAAQAFGEAAANTGVKAIFYPALHGSGSSAILYSREGISDVRLERMNFD